MSKGSDRARKVEAAIRSWTNQLVDLGGRNTLIFYRDQRSGTLDLGTLPPPAIQTLLRGERIDVAAMFQAQEVRADVLRRLRRVQSKSRESLEEQGVSTLFLAVGLASWTSDRTPNPPNAPVLLRPAVLTVKGAARTDFKLTLDGEMEVNPTLLHVLGAEFGREIELDGLDERIDGEIDTPAEIEAAFDVVRQAAAHVPSFTIKPGLILANFSYAKLPMVKDLEAAREFLHAHDMVAALAGDGAAIRGIQDRNHAVSVPANCPDLVLPGQEAIVIDADSSQSFVINAAMAGKDLIVKGPPGTGKSQTIANLIATAAASGKTVLFVAEKRAAIDAVLKRLRDRGLGDLTMDMLGLSTRRAVAETMARSLALVSSVPAPPPDPRIAELAQVRARLAGHVAVLHTPRAPWGTSVWTSRLACHSTPDAAKTNVRLPRPQLEALDAERFAAARDAAAELATFDPFDSRMLESLWLAVGRGPSAAKPDVFSGALDAVSRLRGSVVGIAYDRLVAETADTGLPLPGTVAGWKSCVQAWADVERAVSVFGPDFFGPEPGCVAGVRVAGLESMPDSPLDSVGGMSALRSGDRANGGTRHSVERQAGLVGEWQEQFPALFHDRAARSGVDPQGVLAFAAFDPDLHGLGRVRARIFDSRYRAARSRVRAMLVWPGTSDEEAARVLAGAIRAARYWVEVGGQGLPRVPRPVQGPSFESVYTDLLTLADALNAGAAAPAADGAGAGPAGARSAGARAASFEDLTIEALRRLLDRLARDRGVALRLPRARERIEALEKAGFGEVIAEMADQRLPAALIRARIEFVWHRSLLDLHEAHDPALVAFNPGQQTAALGDFARLDMHGIDTNVSRITRGYAERVVAAIDSYRDQGQLIVHQASLKRGHMPLRKLFAAAPEVLLALKPCWAMSPLMVSQWLPPDRRFFDLVVFDEASQVMPADAVPAILRGKQLVVAGDDRQLPPTTFFASQSLDGDDDEVVSESIPTEGFESVLDSVSPILETAMLRWHYRSRDESLIAFSNRYFYGGTLTTFPSPSGGGAVNHVLVHPSAEPGKGGADDESARDEVNEVVRLVIEAAESRPSETLGVITLGIGHAERIADALSAAVKDRRDLDGYFDSQAHEAFFVKNLERVQGDERDAIILSIGYANTVDGRLLHRFGPLNVEGGERRLNVAITRARTRMTIVSAFTASDIDPRKGLSKGAELLRDYLAYADEAGSLVKAGQPTVELSDFEKEVRAGLAAAGLESVARLGQSDHTIDFAIGHPGDRDRFALAVELDGPSYASIPTTRDRDRLREQQLRRLGWGFLRLWSQLWLDEREAAIAAVRASLEAALRPAAEPPADAVAAAPDGADPPAGQPADAATPVPTRGPRPAIPARKSILSYKPEELEALIDWLESDGVDRSEREVMELAYADLHLKLHTQSAATILSAAIYGSRQRRCAGRYKAYPRPYVPRRTGDWRPTINSLVAWIDSDGLLRTEEQVVETLCRETGWRLRGQPSPFGPPSSGALIGAIRKTREAERRPR